MSRAHLTAESISEDSGGLLLVNKVLLVLFCLAFSLSLTLSGWASYEYSFVSMVLRSLIIAALSFVFLTNLMPLLLRLQLPLHFKANNHKLSIVVFIVLSIVFTYTLAENYPGFYTNDSQDIINQALGVSVYSNWHRYEGLSSHHPIAYTFLVWLFLRFEPIIGLTNSLAAFSVFQALITALSCAYAIDVIDRVCSFRPCVVIAALFFCFNPLIAAYSITMWKDVLFGDAVLVLCSQLLLYSCQTDAVSKRSHIISIALLCLAISLLRSNGPIVAFIVAVTFFALSGELRRYCMLCFAGVLGIVLLVNGPVSSALGVARAHFSETVSVPLQQIARTVVDGGQINEEQLDQIDRIIPSEILIELYVPSTPNPIKFSESFSDGALESDKLGFIRLWIELMPLNLKSYIRAWIFETRGFWEPCCKPILITADNSASFIELKKKSEFGYPFYNGHLLLQEMTPVLYSPGSLAWLLFAFFLIAVCRRFESRGDSFLICFLPLIALYLTLMLASPLSGDYRYFYPALLLVPFYPLISFGCKSPSEGNEKCED